LHEEGLSSLLIYLAAALALVPLCRALGVSAVLGYLAVGILLGPSGLGLVERTREVEIASEIGVLFLLFTIGLELSGERLRALRDDAVRLGTAQILVSGVALAIFVLGVSDSLHAAVAVGFALAMSSTAIVVRILKETGELARRTGQAALAVLLLQDVAVVPLLVVIPLLAGDPVDLLPALALASLKAALAVALLLWLGRRLLRPLFHLVQTTRDPEIGLALTLLVALGTGWATALAGLSPTLGAFLAGVLMAETEYRHQVEADVEPFRGLLLGVFFMSVGLAIDLPFVSAHAGRVLAIALGLVTVKGLILLPATRLLGLSWPQSVHVALLLCQAGEFGFVALGLSVGLGVVDAGIGSELLAAVALTMFASPFLAKLGRGLEERLSARGQPGRDALEAAASGLAGHVVVAGLGRVGTTVIRVLAEHGVAAVGLDIDPLRVSQLRALGFTAFVGDAGRKSLLEAAGVDRARAAVVTLDDPPTAERICATLHEEQPKLRVLARASDLAHGERLLGAGASAAVAENLEGSLELAGRVLAEYELPPTEIERVLADLRADDYARLGST